MATRVTTVTPAATTSVTRIRVGVGVVVPVSATTSTQPVVETSAVEAFASVTAVVPAASIAYIELAFSAVLDTSGRYQFVPELTVVSDGVSLSLAKPLTNLAYAVDDSHYEFEKAVSGDSIALTDEFTKLLTYVRFFADVLNLSEAQVFDIAKLLQDSAVTSDLAAKHVTKPSSDNFALSDSAAKQLAKAIADAYGLTDVSRYSFTKAAFDTVTAPDVVERALFKPFADTFTLQDTELFSLAKLLADGVAMNDGFDAGDGAVYTFSKSVSNVTMVSDATSRQSNKVAADTATTADAGSLISQSYCDITYFAEDYVGESRVF
jgi:hypothetical protein